MMPISWSEINLILRGGWLFVKNKDSFGRKGWGESLGFAYPVLGIRVAYTTNKINSSMASDQRIINFFKNFMRAINLEYFIKKIWSIMRLSSKIRI
jgi:hypothetical protein